MGKLVIEKSIRTNSSMYPVYMVRTKLLETLNTMTEIHLIHTTSCNPAVKINIFNGKAEVFSDTTERLIWGEDLVKILPEFEDKITMVLNEHGEMTYGSINTYENMATMRMLAKQCGILIAPITVMKPYLFCQIYTEYLLEKDFKESRVVFWAENNKQYYIGHSALPTLIGHGITHLGYANTIRKAIEEGGNAETLALYYASWITDKVLENGIGPNNIDPLLEMFK